MFTYKGVRHFRGQRGVHSEEETKKIKSVRSPTIE